MRVEHSMLRPNSDSVIELIFSPFCAHISSVSVKKSGLQKCFKAKITAFSRLSN